MISISFLLIAIRSTGHFSPQLSAGARVKNTGGNSFSGSLYGRLRTHFDIYHDNQLILFIIVFDAVFQHNPLKLHESRSLFMPFGPKCVSSLV
jgi:hypothetical protein